MIAALDDIELHRWVDGNELICPSIWLQKAPDPEDCSTAIKMIPSGKHTFNVESLAQGWQEPADPEKPIGLTIDKRKVLFPAAFVARSCVITVEARPPRPYESRPSAGGVPTKAATAMTFTVWPNVRKLAKIIIRTCVKHRKLNGHVYTHSLLGEWPFQYRVAVAPLAGPPGWLNKFHIYHDPRDGPFEYRRREPTREEKKAAAAAAEARARFGGWATEASLLTQPGSIEDRRTRTGAASRATETEAVEGRQVGCLGGLCNNFKSRPKP